MTLYEAIQSYLYNVIVCFRQGVFLTEKKSENNEVQKHVEACINWLNVYFSDVGSITCVHMPDICVATEMGMLIFSVLLTFTLIQTFLFRTFYDLGILCTLN